MARNTSGSAALARPPRPAFHRITLAHDGTPGCARALEWTAYLALLNDADVTIVSVVPPPEMPPQGMWAYGWWPELLQQYDRIQRSLHDAAESAVDVLRSRGVRADAVVPSGGAVREIARVARDMRADLVVAGDSDRSSFARFFLGSTSDGILARTDASLLLARTAPPPRSILVAVDGSHPSYRATAAALRYAAASGARVTVQHVIDAIDDAVGPVTEGYLKPVVERMALAEHPRARYVLDVGKPASRILVRAADEASDLIVMGARGLGKVAGLLLGSVSHRVAADATASVLVVREAHA